MVLDEVGRGTSTHDGLCIAQAVLEHLHDAIGARTLFATHFHELTALADSLSAVRNVTVAVDEQDGQLSFLYRVVPGAADRSYGVQVARLAGLLGDVTERAAALLREREAEAWGVDARPLMLSGLDRRMDLMSMSAPPVPAADALEAAPTPHPPPRCAGEGETYGGAGAAPRLAVMEEAPAYVPTNGTSESDNVQDEADLFDPMALLEPVASMAVPESGDSMATVDPVDQISSPSPAHGGGGWGVGDPSRTSVSDDNRTTQTSISVPGEVPSQVAAQMLAEILALDLGNTTPIRALTLLHELQTAAREAVPWTDWMANLAGARVQVPSADKKPK